MIDSARARFGEPGAPSAGWQASGCSRGSCDRWWGGDSQAAERPPYAETRPFLINSVEYDVFDRGDGVARSALAATDRKARIYNAALAGVQYTEWRKRSAFAQPQQARRATSGKNGDAVSGCGPVATGNELRPPRLIAVLAVMSRTRRTSARQTSTVRSARSRRPAQCGARLRWSR
jgi:hypothetical protein